MQTLNLNAENSLPHDWQRATLVGRVWLPGALGGPAVVVIRDAERSEERRVGKECPV